MCMVKFWNFVRYIKYKSVSELDYFRVILWNNLVNLNKKKQQKRFSMDGVIILYIIKSVVVYGKEISVLEKI